MQVVHEVCNRIKTIHIFPQTYHYWHSFAVCRMSGIYFPRRRFMLFARVSRGKNRGTRLLPHRFKDDRYHVQLGKEGPYIPVTDCRDIPSYLANGYSLQMSDRAESLTPSLIRPESVHGWSRTSSNGFFFGAL